MKLNLIHLIFAALTGALCFTSCKKESLKTAPANTVNNLSDADVKAAAVQMAVSFYRSVTGTYGGADLKNGIKVSSVNPAARNGRVLQSTNPLCGMTFDTTADNTIINDTTKYRYAGSYAFTYTCSADSPDGYKNNNTFFTSTRTPNTLDSINVAQQYTVKALDNTYKLVSLNGAMQTYEVKQDFNGPFYPYGPNFSINQDVRVDYGQYTLNNIIVDVTSGTPIVTSGSATLSIFTIYRTKTKKTSIFSTQYSQLLLFQEITWRVLRHGLVSVLPRHCLLRRLLMFIQ